MKITELEPEPVNKVLFKNSEFKKIMLKSGCYVLTNFENDILYIGLAVNLNKRFLQHLDNPEKTNPTNEGKAIWFYFIEFDEKNLQKLERTWLNKFTSILGRLPILNKINSPIH